MSSEHQTKICPHCNHPSPQHVVFRQDYRETLHADSGDTYEDVPGTYAVALCETCGQLLLYNFIGGAPAAIVLDTEHLLWPQRHVLTEAVPARVRAIYAEAAAIRDVAPNAFAVQVRRALEALCEDRGSDTGSLGKRLEVLVTRGELPTALAEMSDVLRLLGNIGAHADALEVHQGHVYALDEFFRAITEYIYVAPQRVRAFRQQLEELKKNASKGV